MYPAPTNPETKQLQTWFPIYLFPFNFALPDSCINWAINSKQAKNNNKEAKQQENRFLAFINTSPNQKQNGRLPSSPVHC